MLESPGRKMNIFLLDEDEIMLKEKEAAKEVQPESDYVRVNKNKRKKACVCIRNSLQMIC